MRKEFIFHAEIDAAKAMEREQMLQIWESFGVGWPGAWLPPEIYSNITNQAATAHCRDWDRKRTVVTVRFEIQLCGEFDDQAWEMSLTSRVIVFRYLDEDNVMNLACSCIYYCQPGCSLRDVVRDAMTRASLPSYMVRGENGWMFGSQVNHEPVDFTLLTNCELPEVTSGGAEIFLVNWFSRPEF
jgi:hypothetical protein